MNFTCCSKDPKWVENIPGKGYYFCDECKKEVLAPEAVGSPEEFWGLSRDEIQHHLDAVRYSIRNTNSVPDTDDDIDGGYTD